MNICEHKWSARFAGGWAFHCLRCPARALMTVVETPDSLIVVGREIDAGRGGVGANELDRLSDVLVATLQAPLVKRHRRQRVRAA